jgi:hypothetical protein
VGEEVTGSISGVTKVYVGPRSRFRNSNMLAFEMSAIGGRMDQVAGFERFVLNDVLAGALGGSATVVAGGQGLTVPDSNFFAVSLMHKTRTPTHVLAYDGGTAAFTEGAVLTNGTATARICQVQGTTSAGRLWLRDVVGTFSDNNNLTDDDGGAATANGAAAISGCGAYWVQNTLADVAAGPAAATDFFGDLRPATLTSRKVGAFQAAI